MQGPLARSGGGQGGDQLIGARASGPSSRRMWKLRRASLRAMVSEARVCESPARFEREIVGVIGAGGLAGRLGGFVERPPQRGGALAGDPAGPRASVGAVQANVQAPLQRTAL